jgi:hypothetical protein
MSRDEGGNIERQETPHQRIDAVTDRIVLIEMSMAEIIAQLKNINVYPQDKYKLEQEFIVRYLIQQGYVVEEDSLFETIVAIVTNYKAEAEEYRVTLRG